MGGLFFIIVSACATWVLFDAKRIGAERGLVRGIGNLSPAGWAVATLGLWIVAFPAYLIYRPRIQRAAAGAPEPAEPARLSAWAVAAFYCGLLSILVIPAPIALICGVLGLRDIARHPDKGGRARDHRNLRRGARDPRHDCGCAVCKEVAPRVRLQSGDYSHVGKPAIAVACEIAGYNFQIWPACGRQPGGSGVRMPINRCRSALDVM
jgi:hypothetical protein